MKIGFFLVGIIFLAYGIWSTVNLYRQKEEDKTPFDLSVGIGTIFSIIGGIWLLVKAFE